jgi:hypothetical protein
MGLDNIPHEYPCRKQGTAITISRKGKDGNDLLNDDGSVMTSIDCDATKEGGGCPYKNDYEKSGLTGGSVIGMFGTDCWYRGKYGNYLVEELGVYDETKGLSFYGALGDGTYKSPHECNILADAMEEAAEDYEGKEENRQETKESITYAIWYLRWSAVNTEGLDCWY